MWTDPIIEELHKIRQEHAKAFHYDLKAIVEDLKKQEHQGGMMTYVSLPIKRQTAKHSKAFSKKKTLAAISKKCEHAAGTNAPETPDRLHRSAD